MHVFSQTTAVRWMRSRDSATGTCTTSSGWTQEFFRGSPAMTAKTLSIPCWARASGSILKKGWFATLKGDVGGFGAGSELSWQIYSGVGKEFKQKYSLLLAYRRLDVDYRNSGFVFDTKMNGVMLGFAVRLK